MYDVRTYTEMNRTDPVLLEAASITSMGRLDQPGRQGSQTGGIYSHGPFWALAAILSTSCRSILLEISGGRLGLKVPFDGNIIVWTSELFML